MKCREEKLADMESKDSMSSPVASLAASEDKGAAATEADAAKELFAAQSNIQDLLAEFDRGKGSTTETHEAGDTRPGTPTLSPATPRRATLSPGSSPRSSPVSCEAASHIAEGLRERVWEGTIAELERVGE